MAEKVGRNDPCPCGSGKKYKQCCQKKEQSSGAKYTASGKRKLRATQVGSAAQATTSLFGRVKPVQEEVTTSETLEKLKYRMTNRDFRTEEGEEAKKEPPQEQLDAPETQAHKIPEADAPFKPTQEDFRQDEEGKKS